MSGITSPRPPRRLVPLGSHRSADAGPIWRRLVKWVVVAVGVCACVVFLALAGLRIAAALRETETAEARAPRTGQFIETPAGRVFVQVSGPAGGRPVVLVHGTAAWSEFWRATIDHLVHRGHRVIALDLPPFGFSGRSASHDYTRGTQALRFAGVLNALGIDRATLVGHSFGAGATMETAMRYPDRMRGLILVAPALGLPEPGVPPGEPSRILMALLHAPVIPEVLISATVTNPLLTRTLLGVSLARKEAATPELATLLQRPMRQVGSTPEFAAWLRGFLTTDHGAMSADTAKYRAMALPTHLIWGDADALTPIAQGYRLARLLPNAKLSIVPRVGHFPQIEDPAVFFEHLDAALAELP